MPTEDLTTYTLVSAGGTLSRTASRATAAEMPSRSADGYVQADKGAAHFTGNFDHLLTIFTDSADINGALWCKWLLSQVVGDFATAQANGALHALYAYGPTNALNLYDNVNQDTFTYSDDTPYYCRIERVGTTLTCKIYSDSGRTNLLDTLSISVTATAFRYIAVNTTYNTSGSVLPVSGYVENLDLQEGGAAPVSLVIPEYATNLGNLMMR